MRGRLAPQVVLVVAGLAVLVALGAAAGPAHAIKSRPAPRLHVELGAVEATVAQAPSELTGRARELFGELVAGRADLVPIPPGAPDPRAQPLEYRRFLDDQGIRAFAVTLRLTEYQRSLAPAAKGAGQLLTVRVGVSLVGTQIPGDALALSGAGRSTVAAEVGAALRPGEEAGARDDALRDALTHALDDAVGKLKAPPKAAPPKAAPPKAAPPKRR